MEKFKAAFIAHAPDAEVSKHKCQVETNKYKLFVQLVRTQPEALEAARKLVEEDGVQSIILCPGFTYKDVAEIQAAVEGKAAICMSHSDPPGSRITAAVMERVGWFRK
ncbi:MAG: DUF6506 family protein [Candidatus Saccharicenans sp.]|jgi:DNA-binding LacI/PurR family transcriptional regulator|nr:DUF6506 family protein [Candidatus Saccharicenans sp.]MDH7494133.1 DUF6506 family protein [Candidatus Saccharicenans sp.]